MVDGSRYKKALSKTLRSLRGTRSQREVAEAAGMPASTWSKIEHGRQLPRDETFARIAGALGYTVPVLERIVSERLLEELESERRATRISSPAPPPAVATGHGDEEWDLGEVPASAARQLEAVMDTIVVLRRHLHSLELDLRSLTRDLQALGDAEGSSGGRNTASGNLDATETRDAVHAETSD